MGVVRGIAGVLAGVVAAIAVAGPAWAGGPDGVVESDVVSRAVGSGLRDGVLVGFSASGPTNTAASAAVIEVCQNAGAEQCSSDEVTNDVFCVVSIGADDGSGIVAGGAGLTVDAARDDAIHNVGRADLVIAPDARVLASSCP